MTAVSNTAASALRRWREHPAVMVRELFGVEPDPWQDEALEAFPSSPRLCLRACKGPGKVQPRSMIVDTPAGRRRWGDLEAGDQLFAEDGSPTKIVRTYDSGVVPLYRVTFDDGASTLAGAEHFWKVRGRTERRKNLGWSVLTTAQIIERGVTIPNGGWAQFIIPRHGAVQYAPVAQVLDPYVVGVWLGDGTRDDPSYTKPDREIEDEINRRGYPTSRAAGDRVRLLGAAALFRALECADKGSPERFIPVEYREASIDQRRDLLCGLMDTDGSIGKDGHMEYATTSERLALDVVWLVRSLGGVALVKDAIKEGWYTGADGGRVQCRDCYRVTVVLPFNPFRVGHKAERWSDPALSPSTERYLTRFIAGIEPEGEADAMCVEIDHPSRCYLANDFIVTHNTAVLAWIGWNFLLTRPHPMAGATSISGDNLKANLWTELARWRARSPLLEAGFEQTKTEIFNRDHPKTWKLEARTWAKDADAAQIGNALAGIHAPYVLWLLDESGDYPDAIMPTAEGIFAGEPTEAHIVQAGNPTRLSGPLYRACTSARRLWRVIEITGDPDDPKRSSRISVEHAREQIEQYGRDNAWVLVNIFGRFPPSSIDGLIGPDEVAAAMKRYYREYEIGNAPKVLGVDVARFGDDASVIFPRRGVQAFAPLVYRGLNSTQGAGHLARKWDDWDADASFIDDSGGFGSGWIDQLMQLGKTPIGVQFAAKAHDSHRYYNKRAEMYFDAVAWIKRGGALPECPELLAGLTQTTYTFRGDAMLLEPKDVVKAKLGYSPDHCDAFVLTFAEPVSARNARHGRPRMTADYDPFAGIARGYQQPRGVTANYDEITGR